MKVKCRYTMIMQRTLRHKLFVPPVMAMPQNMNNTFSLQTVEQVLGSQAAHTKAIVLGMLAQIKEGRFVQCTLYNIHNILLHAVYVTILYYTLQYT